MNPILSLLLLHQSAGISGVVYDGTKPASDAVVWLEGGTKSTPIRADIEQKGKKFLPRILVVTKGSKVGFPNRDDVFHNVFAEYNAKKFDLGMYPKNQTRMVVFDKPGVVSVLCNVHSDMSAYVVVVDSSHYTKSGRDGKFSMNGLPAGKYTLVAWHESGKKFRQEIVIPSAGSLAIKLAR